MIYELKNCRTGESHPYNTTVDITEHDGILTFVFECDHSAFNCPYHNYNDIHSCGDAVEILIGSDKNRRVYYEIELSSEGVFMLSEMTNSGFNEKGDPILGLNLVPENKCFVSGNVEKRGDGYRATIIFPKDKARSGDDGDRIYFNAYRLETDGEEMNKHLLAMNPTMVGKFHMTEYFTYLDEKL
jgi:hypothetical protein